MVAKDSARRRHGPQATRANVDHDSYACTARGTGGNANAIATAPNADDLIVEREGARLFVDPVSLPFLLGSEVDWVDELIGSSFKVKNPNAKSSCGCGVSFSV